MYIYIIKYTIYQQDNFLARDYHIISDSEVHESTNDDRV